MKRILAMLLSLAIVAGLAISGTVAYLQDTDEATNTMTLGEVEIIQRERERDDQGRYYDNFTQDQPLYPAVIDEGGIQYKKVEWYRGDDYAPNSPYQPVTKDNPDVEYMTASMAPFGVFNGEILFGDGKYKDADINVVDTESINNYIDKAVSISNAGDSDAYVRTVIAIPSGGWQFEDFIGENSWFHFDYVANTNLRPDYEEYQPYWHWNKNANGTDNGIPTSASDWDVVTGPNGDGVEIDGIKYFIFTATHSHVLPEPAPHGVTGTNTFDRAQSATGYRTAPNLLGFYMDPHVDSDFDSEAYETTWWYRNGNIEKPIENFMDEEGKFNILVKSQAVQAMGFDNAWQALDSAFGDITFQNHPWTTVVNPEAPTEQDGAYEISTVDQLFGFAEAVNNGNNFEGKTVKLTADLNLNYANWEPIGNTFEKAFKGSFDGQNHTIENLYVDVESGAGLFGFVVGDISNVYVENAFINSKHWAGGIVGYIYGNVTGCKVTTATIECIDTVTGEDMDGDKAGAIVGQVCEFGTEAGKGFKIAKNVATDVTITANRDAGQIVGCAHSTANVVLSGREKNSVKNVTVTASGHGTGANINNAFVGRTN